MATTNQTIQSYYQTILLRTASTNEVAYWANQVDQAGVPLTQVETSFVISAEAQTWVAPIAELYQAYLGRAPDAAGLSAWVHAEESGTSLSTIASAFAASAESVAFYGSAATVDSAFVTKLYQTILNRAPESAAVVANWVSTATTKAALEATFFASAEAKSVLGVAANGFLTAVGNGTASAYSLAGGPSLFTSAVSPGTTFVLSNGIDAGAPFTGGAGNDTFVATVNQPGLTVTSTLNAGDSLDGAGGTNTLKIIDTLGNGVNVLAGVSLANIQIVSDQNASLGGASTADFTLYPTVSQVVALNTANGGVDTFTGLATGAQVVASGAGTGAATTIQLAMKTATDAVSVGVDGGVNGAVFVVSGGAPTAATISSTGAANGTKAAPDVFVLSGGGTVKTVAVNAATNLIATLGGVVASTSALTVGGAATSVNLGGGIDFKTIDASGLTGGGLTMTTFASLTSLTGGGGNDVITIGAAQTAAATINLGAGNDKLLGTVALPTTTTVDGGTGTNTLSSGLVNAGNASKFTNFQVLSLDSTTATTLDTSLIAGLKTLSVDVASPGVGATYTNLASTASLTDTFVGDNSAATNTLTFTGLTGSSNAYAITFGGAAQTTVPVAANVLLGNVAAQGINNFTINSAGGTNTWNAVTLGTDTTANTVAITGAQNLNLSFAGFGSIAGSNTGVSLIDGSAATGKLNIAATGGIVGAGATGAGLTIKGGSGDDTLAVISPATMTGGAGADTFDGMNFANSGATNGAAIVTDFTVGTDKLALVVGPVDTFVTAMTSIGVSTDLSSALNIATVAGKITWFQFGSNTYVDEAGTATATGAFNGGAGAGSAHVIQLSGLVDLSGRALTGSTLA